MMNLNQLRVFYEAARCESFTMAAKNLFITQPAVTAQMKTLEDQCNLKLFKKKGRKLFLTDEGSTLYEYVRKLFDYEKEVEGVIEDMRELKRGILRLGTSKAYARYIMPFLISGFREAYPQIKVYLDEGSSLDMARSLLSLKNEVAVIAKVEEDPGITYLPFSQEELLLVLPPHHPLTKKKRITVEELVSEALIMKEVGSGTRKTVNDLFCKKRLVPNVLMETSNTEFIKQLVQRGEGLSFLVMDSVAAEIGDKKLATVPLDGERPHLDVSIAYLKDQHLSHPARAFVEILTKMATKKSRDQGIRKVMAEYLANWQYGNR
jgi:DNA-binding transcriptional LysR family regulator